jgi:cysteine-rich repeat protein
VTNAANGLQHRRTDIRTFFAICGNTTLELGEDCDDGNTAGGDTCPATCVR